jgi:hypothetical protein
MKNIPPKQQNPVISQDDLEWTNFSDNKKTKWFLNSDLMPDFETFLEEFESYEQPSNNKTSL